MKDLIEYMARAIVDNPDAVVVTEEEAEDHIVFHLLVADDDMGRVIGKQGRIANAMRTLLKVAAIRRGERAVLEIGQDQDRDDDYDRGRREDRGTGDDGSRDGDTDNGDDRDQDGPGDGGEDDRDLD